MLHIVKTLIIKVFVVRVTVQFETEGNGQNEIVSHLDRSEVDGKVIYRTRF